MKLTFLVVIVFFLSAFAFSRELRRKPFRKIIVGDIWSNCTSKDDVGNIEFVKVTPDEVKENSDLNVFVKYNLKSDVTDGTVYISLPNIPIVGNMTVGVCDALSFIGSGCPLKAGPGMFNVTQTIPELGITAQVNGTVIAKDQNMKEIFCVKLNFKLQD